jgi:hypothetical protein
MPDKTDPSDLGWPDLRCLDQPDHVRRKVKQVIGFHVLGTIAAPVSALVGRNHVPSRFRLVHPDPIRLDEPVFHGRHVPPLRNVTIGHDIQGMASAALVQFHPFRHIGRRLLG